MKASGKEGRSGVLKVQGRGLIKAFYGVFFRQRYHASIWNSSSCPERTSFQGPTYEDNEYRQR